MSKRDARSLDHKTLEEIRIRAVEGVQAGESPEVVTQLRKMMLEELQRRNYSQTTVNAYLKIMGSCGR